MPQIIFIIVAVAFGLYFLSETFDWAVGLVGHPTIVLTLLAILFAAIGGFRGQEFVRRRHGPRKALWPFWVGLVAATISVVVFGQLMYR